MYASGSYDVHVPVRRGVLSPAAIVAAGIEVADTDGLAAVTVRRIAEMLGTGVMSLYRHVPHKERLVELMVDEVTGQYAYPPRAGRTWRECMWLLAECDWRMYRDHPWVLHATASARPPLGPNVLRSMEWALEAVEELGLDVADAATVVLAVATHVQGSALIAGTERELAASDGTDARDWWKQRIAQLPAGENPRVRRTFDSRIADLDPEGWMRAGVALILDGAERLATGGAGRCG